MDPIDSMEASLDGSHCHGGVAPQPPNFKYRGRVRTGCLTCRRRKIKCDEQRPSCNNCMRSTRNCVYQLKKVGYPNAAPRVEVHECPMSQSSQGLPTFGPDTRQDADLLRDGLFIAPPLSAPPTPTTPSPSDPILQPLQSPASSESTETVLLAHHDYRQDGAGPAAVVGASGSPSAQSLMTSQDISLCTTIDYLEAVGIKDRPSFSFFIEEVNLPLISPYDDANWRRVKTICTELSADNGAMFAAILAVQELYKAQVTGLSTSHAVSLYGTATAIFVPSLENLAQDIDTVLIISFLLCLFEIIVPNETYSVLSQTDGAFVARLEATAIHGHYSAVALRISSWLRIIHAATRRGGNLGILSDNVSSLLPSDSIHPPSLSMLDKDIQIANSMYDILSAPIFTFYFELQCISTQIANLSHYHRSRTTGEDQEEVAELMSGVKTRLKSIWQARPGPMRFEASELRVQLSPSIAEPLVTLVGIATAAYHAEIVEVGRTLSDPPLASPEAMQAMRCIRDIVENGDWNAYASTCNGAQSYNKSDKLHPAYLRPLFLYAIESIHLADAQWAVDHIKRINNHICRSEFFARFAESLTEAQRSKGRRVTTRYFCYQAFGVAPPYL
ncbi:hypothetical protein V1525DRAFT_78291 [Lipomyces kononenkoae]|uniref:Uncharacterized protein n=1 Tax=Lipomyces kononenkoae TaxID=34357 RepID=A0ACC3SRB7_LIPKO